MKTIFTLLFIACWSSTLIAQDFSGKWEGKLDVNGGQLRLVFHVEKAGQGYKTTMDSPDQNATGIAVQATTTNDKTVKFELPNIGGEFEGTLSDASTIKGNWKQGGMTLPLTLTKGKKE